ncbi:unnamed protein product [Ectocarpus fasciculatus]
MQLIQIIEDAVRKNCNVAPSYSNAKKKLTNAFSEDDPQLPRIMFVGLCHQHGIRSQEIQDYLCLTKSQVNKKIGEFQAFIDEGQPHYENRQKGAHYESDNTGYRFLVQANMCNSYLSSRATSFVGLREIMEA